MIKRQLLPFAFGTTFLAFAVAAWAAFIPVNDWKIAGPFGGTAITIAVDPQNPSTVLAGAMNSLLFQSDDSGGSWNLLNFPKRNLSEVTSILIDPANSHHYLAGMITAEDGGLFDSQDEGKTWTVVKDLREVGIRALGASPSQPSRFVAGTLRGVMLSEDSGKTWKRISDPQNPEMQGITAVAFDTANSDVIYAGTMHLPWKTTDAGKTWSSIHTGMIDDSDVFSIYVNPATPKSILASACSGVYASTNAGELWHKLLGIPNTSRRTHVVREDPSNPNTIYAGTTTGLFKSVNHGVSWKTMTNTQVNALAFDPSHPGNMYLALEYEGIGKSGDGGERIDLLDKGFVDRVISSVTISGKKLVAVETQEGETTGIFLSSDQGESWSQLRNTRGLGGVHLKAIAGIASEERILLAASPHQMYKSIDGGATWKPIPVRLIVNPPAETQKPKSPATLKQATHTKGAVRKTAVRPVKPRAEREITLVEISGLYPTRSGTKDVIFAATDLGLLKTTDMGEHWTSSDVTASSGVTALYSAPTSNGYLIARAAGSLFLSKDFGDHWAELFFPLPASDVNDIAIPPDPNAPLFVATRLGLYSSPDGGAKWYANLGGMPASTVSSVIYSVSQRIAYAVEYGQLYETRDGGNSWSLIPTAIPGLRIRQLWMPDRASNRIYGITSDLGILFRN